MQNTMAFSGAAFTLGAVLMAAANNLAVMFVGRVVLGIGVGAGESFFPHIYIYVYIHTI